MPVPTWFVKCQNTPLLLRTKKNIKYVPNLQYQETVTCFCQNNGDVFNTCQNDAVRLQLDSRTLQYPDVFSVRCQTLWRTVPIFPYFLKTNIFWAHKRNEELKFGTHKTIPNTWRKGMSVEPGSDCPVSSHINIIYSCWCKTQAN